MVGPKPTRSGPAFLLHAIMDLVVNSYFPVVQMVEDEVLEMEQRLLDATTPDARPPSAPPQDGVPLPVEGRLPPLAGATAWFNGAPITREALCGKVLLVDLWTYCEP